MKDKDRGRKTKNDKERKRKNDKEVERKERRTKRDIRRHK